MSSTKTSESDLVRSVLQMMQGFNTSLFQWDQNANTFRVSKVGVYVTHLSLTSLHNLLTQFVNAANCLQRVEAYVKRVELDSKFPTLTAFASSVSLWIKKLREIALKEEVKICSGNAGVTATLLGFSSSLSSLCSAAECLLQIVQGAIPRVYFDHNWPASAAEIAVHVLDYLYKKLDEVCLVQGGEEEVYQMVLHIFVGSLVPYIHSLDSWLFEGTLDDPYVELFFYANNAISIDDSEFWEKSYQLRQVQSRKLDYEFSSLTLNKKEPGQRDSSSFSASVTGKEQESKELKIFPSFIRDIAKSIVSAGKSLQLIRHGPTAFPVASNRSSGGEIDFLEGSNEGISISRQQHSISGLTLSEIFCISVAALIGHGDHISRHVLEHNQSSMIGEEDENFASFLDNTHTEKIWYKFLVGALSNRKLINSEPAHDMNVVFSGRVEECDSVSNGAKFTHRSFCPENPVITVCQTSLGMRRDAWKALNLSDHFSLPALNDEKLREAIFGGQRKPFSIDEGTHYAFGFQFGRSELLRSQGEKKLLEDLFPFPTILPPFQVDDRMSELLPFQKNSTLTSRVLSWIQSTEPRTTPLPHVIVQECLVVYMTKQIDYIGGLILSKLMDDWRLMDELSVLRAIYLLGSGDLLQHFLTVLFTKLDRGETWDDDFELNTILQESICNSSDGMLLSAPDSLLLTITKNHDADDLPGTPALSATPRKNRMHNLGIDCLESLKFTYKVSWPLELIANVEAIKKYNQVMAFLLKVKRAKFVLDKARRWMWKGRGNATNSRKHHWLVEQKLLHFVDAFHQYVMDRVYHSAWRELCDGVAAAASLDEVIEVHEAYLLSIQRQCFVVPDKLWAMIASRINSILGLALDFHSVQQTLSSGVAAPAMMARCETEVDRIEKQFDECIAFLLRVLSFKLNVGHFPHLADLVTRINYNYFYMSISGNLVNATGPETVASRLGKISGARIQ